MCLQHGEAGSRRCERVRGESGGACSRGPVHATMTRSLVWRITCPSASVEMTKKGRQQKTRAESTARCMAHPRYTTRLGSPSATPLVLGAPSCSASSSGPAAAATSCAAAFRFGMLLRVEQSSRSPRERRQSREERGAGLHACMMHVEAEPPRRQRQRHRQAAGLRSRGVACFGESDRHLIRCSCVALMARRMSVYHQRRRLAKGRPLQTGRRSDTHRPEHSAGQARNWPCHKSPACYAQHACTG